MDDEGRGWNSFKKEFPVTESSGHFFSLSLQSSSCGWCGWMDCGVEGFPTLYYIWLFQGWLQVHLFGGMIVIIAISIMFLDEF